MNAEVKPSYDTNRQRLANLIPLNTPFTIFIEPTRYCNFKCFYCLHTTRGDENGEFAKTGYQIKNMDFAMYEKILEQFMLFPEHPKRLVFSGLGEPLMNPELPKMIGRARDSGMAQRLDILTNASLLSPAISDQLIAAGTTRIQISLQGLDSQKYKEVSGTKVDFDTIYENLTYLYTHKRNCLIFIKIIDSLLDGEKDKYKFYKLFGNISDQMFIEHLITLQQQMGDHGGKADNSRNLNNEDVIYRHVCPVIFYMLQIDADGNVFPCPVGGLPEKFAMGNINEESIVQIWHGRRRKNLIRSHLMLNRRKISVCATCSACNCVLDANEYLDDVAGQLLRHF
ncbi:MAG TPA: radical SAM protein [Methylomusa anaerophila]|uniref:Pyrroloquinoline quinone biosynthesis protein PqqE n=1 Tax=Methylomusa anaerophila TaxID=1930071 RepID=A0A348AH67_9FIRM|nr:radical SAM protein [Methylomusa anaerophila]BBB90415.1 pyrroloquinoline quinone biosynthesis protein PqqE [Methylomusa anaerophila]HML90370.1 radical SAM protein [Methylomusa anaerophila]